jgi:glucokinase
MTTVWAVDVGGTKVEVGVGLPSGEWLATRRLPTPDLGQGEAIVSRLADALDAVADAAGVRERPSVVGIGSPGPLDTRRGIILRPANMPGWYGLAIVPRLSERLGVPVYLENDATAAALGEWRFGAGRGTGDLVYVTVSTGIGAGIVSGGRLVEGVGSNAGEIGHVTVEPDGLPCHCGLRGCLETVASGTAIAREGEARRDQSPRLAALRGPVDAAAVFAAAREGDPVAQDILDRVTDRLAWAFGLLINLFNPARLIVGGGVAVGNGAALLEPVRARLSRYAMPDLLKAVQLMEAALGERAGLAGALAVALTRHGA